MRKFRKQLFKYTVVSAILISLGVTGCGLNSYNGEKIPETASLDSSSNYNKEVSSVVHGEDTAGENLDNDAAEDADTSVSSGYYLSLGVLNENIVFNGAERNESEMAVAGKKVIFPQGGIRSISIKSWSRKEKSYNPPKPEIIQYVDALESAEIIDSIPENVFKNMVKIEVHMLYLNSHGKFRTICVTDFGNGYHQISVEMDNAKDVSIKSDAGENYSQVFLYSMEAENIIKEWINWESAEKKEFEMVQSASMYVNGDMNGIALTKEQLKKLKTYLKAGKKTAENPCGCENYFECIKEDGNSLHFSISADGENITTDKSVYAVDYPDNLEIVELFKELYKQLYKSANE